MGTSQVLLKVLDYMEQNLSQTMSLQELSEIAGYSVPQFYRLFKQLTGDTVGEYLLRRRMSEAAMELKTQKKTITEIAFQYGFQSHDVFTRSFRRVYGMTPNQYQHSDVVIQPLKRFEIQSQPEEKEESSQMIFSIEEKKQIQVIGMECVAHTWDSDGAIGELWCEFLERQAEIDGVSQPVTMYGICEEETCQENQFTYMAAIGVDQIEYIPKGMKMRTIGAQKYFKAKVPPKITTPDAYTGTINYAKSLGFQICWKDELEVYVENFQDPDRNRFELYIPIQ